MSNSSINLARVKTQPVATTSNKDNIVILENQGLDGSSGYLWLRFQFDYEQDKGIVARLTNIKRDREGNTWSLVIEKCAFLGITQEEQRESFDIAQEVVNVERLTGIVTDSERLKSYLADNIVWLIKQKIKYTKFVPQFNFFLSHKARDKPVVRSFLAGLKFLGYDTWIDEDNMGMGDFLDPSLKVAVEKCDCLVAWVNQEYLTSDYCLAELIYANNLNKIIMPFGVYSDVSEKFVGELAFLKDIIMSAHNQHTFFEVLRRIDAKFFNFEKMALPVR